MSGTRGLAGLTVICLLAALFLPPIAQPLAYHNFADHREWLGVANFFDVASNAAFLIAGSVCLTVALRATTFEQRAERWPYVIFALGMLLTALGSSYYHLAPDNERLFWDRLPMTIAFMSLISAQIVERINVRAGLALLVPLLSVGAASVVYWLMTERTGAGNVLPYAVLQGYAVIALLLIAITQRSRYTRSADLYYVFGWYVAAKIFEALDAQIWSLGNVVSGHTLKHLSAGCAGLVLCRMLSKRILK